METARNHGHQRSLIGWAYPDLIRDYEILHEVIHQHLTETLGERYTPRQAKALGTEMLEATGAAAEAYAGLVRERLESQVRELTLELTQAEYRQRQETATILHDNLQQVIVAARMRLDPIAEEVQKAHDYLTEAIEVTRDLASELHPVVLDEEGRQGRVGDALLLARHRGFRAAAPLRRAGPGSRGAASPSGHPLRVAFASLRRSGRWLALEPGTQLGRILDPYRKLTRSAARVASLRSAIRAGCGPEGRPG